MAGSQEGNIPSELAFDDEALKKIAARPHGPYPEMEFMNDSDCDFKETRKRFNRIVDNLLKIGKKALVYLPPTTPLVYENAPACYIKNMREMISARSGERVVTEAGLWDSYGLSYRHYVVSADRQQGSYRLDKNHPNIEGARIITSRLAEMMIQSEGEKP